MRVRAAVTVLVAIAAVGIAAPASGASAGPEAYVSATEASSGARSYVDDPDYFLFYLVGESSSNCGGNPACDIDFSSYVVDKEYPEDLVAVIGMNGPTDPELSNSEKGGMLLLIDSDDDRSDWDYRMWTRTMTYPLKQTQISTISQWDGDSWESTTFTGGWYRSDTAWLATIPFKKMGITSAMLAVRASDATGTDDYSPSKDGTPLLPIAALVAGAPGQPSGLKATAGPGQVALTWQAPKSTGSSAITSYTVTASPGGATCTSSTTSCTVTGLTAGTAYRFTVTATNAQGTGPESEGASATPTSAVLAAPTNVKATYAVKGTKGTATVTWTRPAGATSVQVRWALNGGSFTAWKPVIGDRATVPGLVKGKITAFEVRGANASGPGKAAAIKLSIK